MSECRGKRSKLTEDTSSGAYEDRRNELCEHCGLKIKCWSSRHCPTQIGSCDGQIRADTWAAPAGFDFARPVVHLN